MSRDEDDGAISKQAVCSLHKSLAGQQKPLWVRTWRSVHLGWLVTLGVSSVVLAATIVAPVLPSGRPSGETVLLMSLLVLAEIGRAHV